MLGWAAFAPLAALGLLAWVTPRGPWLVLEVIAADAWGGGLLCFFAGVRRGLTFSERRGGGVGEIATFLLLFFVGVAGIALAQPLLLALGFVGAGAADLRAAKRREAPAYFARLRPAQALVGAVALVAVFARVALPSA